MVRIGVDANCWANRRGYGRYARELLNAALQQDQANEYTFYLDGPTARTCEDLPRTVRRVVVECRQAATEAASASGSRSLRDLWAMSRAVYREGRDLDIFYFPSVYTYFPPITRAKCIVTIHDTIPERHPSLVFPSARARLFWRLKLRLALGQARSVVTGSETARKAIEAEYGVPPGKIKIVGDAPSGVFRPEPPSDESRALLARYGIALAEPFVIYAGGISPHKNLATLVAALAAVCRQPEHARLKLVLVGDYERDVFYSDYGNLRSKIAEEGVDGNVVFTGFVPDKELAHLYNAARMLVLPSLDEGFGLPVVEAMACGTPVVVSRAGALPEVVGDAGALCNPREAGEFADAIRTLLEDEVLRTAQSYRARERARTFSWQRSATALLGVFEELMRSPSSARPA